MIAIMFVMFGMTIATYAQSPIIMLGKAIGELAVAPVGIAVGAVEGIAGGVCESVEYLVTGQTTTKTTVQQTTVIRTVSAQPVLIVPEQPKEQRVINISNSENVNVVINETNVSSSRTATPTTVVVPRPPRSYYYYQPYNYCHP